MVFLAVLLDNLEPQRVLDAGNPALVGTCSTRLLRMIS
jgi:hypothetical protein